MTRHALAILLGLSFTLPSALAKTVITRVLNATRDGVSLVMRRLTDIPLLPVGHGTSNLPTGIFRINQ